eukprot:scaffold7863_cov37-Cyclotella_meneghiniana.AAC.3
MTKVSEHRASQSLPFGPPLPPVLVEIERVASSPSSLALHFASVSYPDIRTGFFMTQGSSLCQQLIYVSDKEILCMTPKHIPTTVSLKVSNSGSVATLNGGASILHPITIFLLHQYLLYRVPHVEEQIWGT